MEHVGFASANTVGVIQKGRLVRSITRPASISSRKVGWNGVALEAFEYFPAGTLPQHEHHTHFLSLFTSGRLRVEAKVNGRAGTADYVPGSLCLLGAGTTGLASWSAPSSRIIMAIQPHFIAGILDETAHLPDIEVHSNWSFEDRHIETILRALYADLKDGSPAGALYGQSLSVALAHYLVRRHAVKALRAPDYRTGMPAARLSRVLDFMRQNYAQENHLWELANLAGMSPHYFCDLFKKSTGISPHQYVLRCRIERAKELLRSPQFTVGEVAAATGFADQSHFSKVFRRMVGRTPVQFRA